MAIKAIIKGCKIDNCVRCWTRHATPRAFTHMIVSGPSGRAALNHIDVEAEGLFVFRHPDLGDWATVPALGKREADGGVLHAFAGVTPDDGGEQLDAEEFAGLDAVELYVAGHVERFINGTRRDGQPFVGLSLTDATLLDSIVSGAVVYRSDQDAWALVDAAYKSDSGGPRVEPDDVQETAVAWPPQPPEEP